MIGDPVRRPGELAFSLSLLVFSLALFWQAYSISGFASLSSAGLMPMLATGTMAISMAVVVLKDRRNPANFEGPAARRFVQTVLTGRIAVFSALMIGYILVLGRLGFVLSTFAFLVAAMSYLRSGRPLQTLIVALASTAVVYLIFRTVFSVVLPTGIWL